MKGYVFIANAKKFFKNLDFTQEEVRKVCLEALPKGLSTFAKIASDQTYPQKKTLNAKRPSLDNGISPISDHPYYRTIIDLRALCSKHGIGRLHATKEDYDAVRAGMKYKVINSNRMTQKEWKYVYARTKGEAITKAKIHARAYAKAQWGTKLEDVGAKVPPSVMALIRKLDTNRVESDAHFEGEGSDLQTLSITNNASYLDKVCKGDVERIAEPYVKKTLMAEIYKRLKYDKDV